MTPVSKRHHWVPRFYLKRFADADGLIWLHDLNAGSSLPVSPGDALVKKYLYAPKVGENPDDDVFERFLADHVDGPAVAPLNRLAAGDPVSYEDRQRIAIFVAYQEYRVPRMKDAIQRFMGEVAQRILRMSVERPESMKRTFEAMGKPISDADLERLVTSVKNGDMKVKVNKIPWLAAGEVPTDIAGMLVEMPWAVLEAPGGFEFLTSDCPIAKVVTDSTVPPMLAGGWLSPSAESTLALDPSHVLLISPNGREGRATASEAWCRDVNRRLVQQAQRFVVSRNPDPDVAKLAQGRRVNAGESDGASDELDRTSDARPG
jgi:Protein of unknown function (DUF4238)